MKRITNIAILILIGMYAYAWRPCPLPFDSADYALDTLHYGLGISAVAAGGDKHQAPLWLHANTNGDISMAAYSGNITAYTFKPDNHPNRWWDYSFGIQLTGRIDTDHSTGYLQQLYAHARLLIFDITAGIKPMTTTFGDASLSTGSLLFSNNAHNLPRVSIGVDRWTSLPFCYGYVEFRGALTHAWATDALSGYYLHHKYIGGRIGGKLPVHFSYEFHHAAQWGGKSDLYGNLGNDWHSFVNTFLARGGGTSAIENMNAQGNHLCMQQMALEADITNVHIAAYWQILQEDGPIGFMGTTMNKHDGLWGVQISQNTFPYINGICYEYLNTTDQSGPVHDIDGYIFGGRDDYYKHAIYSHGWTYFGRTIGNPMISLNSNRVKAHHMALKGNINTYYYRLLCTNMRYFTPYAEDISFNQAQQIILRQTSLFLEVEKTIEQAWGLTFALALAADLSDHGNTVGGLLSIRKHFEYTHKQK